MFQESFTTFLNTSVSSQAVDAEAWAGFGRGRFRVYRVQGFGFSGWGQGIVSDQHPQKVLVIWLPSNR